MPGDRPIPALYPPSPPLGVVVDRDVAQRLRTRADEAEGRSAAFAERIAFLEQELHDAETKPKWSQFAGDWWLVVGSKVLGHVAVRGRLFLADGGRHQGVAYAYLEQAMAAEEKRVAGERG